LKLLVFSHACATPINQQFFAAVGDVFDDDIQIIVPSNWKSEYGPLGVPKRWPEFRGKLIPIPVVKSGNIPLHFYRARLGRIFQKLKPDAIYVHNEPYAASTFQAAAANRLSRQVPFAFFSCQNIRKKYPPPFAQMEKFVYRQTNLAFPVTTSIEDILRAKGYTSKTFLKPFTVDSEIYHRKHSDRSRDAVFTMGYIGRIVEEKGLSTFAKALGQIKELNWRLMVAGGGEYESTWFRMLDQYGIGNRVTKAGFISHAEVSSFYSQIDLSVLPSETRSNWKEQFGRVIIESLSCGTPVVGSDSGHIPVLLKETGGGLIFREGSSSSLAGALRFMIQNPTDRLKMSYAGREVVLQRYTLKPVAKQFAESIHAMVGGIRLGLSPDVR